VSSIQRQRYASWSALTGQLLQELLFVQAIFEGFTAVNENDRNFVRELSPELVIRLDVNFPPAKASPAFQLCELLFDDLAEVTSFPGIYDDFAQEGHRAEFSKPKSQLPEKEIAQSSEFWKERNSISI
jgi:hypothetical protein